MLYLLLITKGVALKVNRSKSGMEHYLGDALNLIKR